MKYIDEFRDGEVAKGLAAALYREVDPARSYRFMEFCGGHTHAISRYGLSDLLPENIRMIHGPGCPVCVLPIGRIDQAIRLALDHDVILCPTVIACACRPPAVCRCSRPRRWVARFAWCIPAPMPWRWRRRIQTGR